jgi:hypothetical protein
VIFAVPDFISVSEAVHLLEQSLTLHFAHRVCLQVSNDSQNKQ